MGEAKTARAVVLAVVLAAAVAAGCADARQAADARRVERAAARFFTANSGTGRFLVSTKVVEAPPKTAGNQQLQPVEGAGATVRYGLLLAPTQGRSQLVAGTPDASVAAATYDRSSVFVRTTAPEGAAGGWNRLDLSGDVQAADPREPAKAVASFLAASNAGVSPTWVPAALKGTLTGSVEVVGEERIFNVAVERFKVNISRDEMFERGPLTRREHRALNTALANIAVNDEVIPAEAWIDERGNLRKASLTLTSRPPNGGVFEFTYTIEITTLSRAASEVVRPNEDETVEVDAFDELLRPGRALA